MQRGGEGRGLHPERPDTPRGGVLCLHNARCRGRDPLSDHQGRLGPHSLASGSWTIVWAFTSRHRVYQDPRDGLYWCNTCGAWSVDANKARAHRKSDAPYFVQKECARRPLATQELQLRPTPQIVPTSPAPLSAPATAEADSTQFKTCPDCAEPVRAAAKKCRFCGYIFETSQTPI
jgi:hypothetical protein